MIDLLHKKCHVEWKSLAGLTFLIILAFSMAGCGAINEMRATQQMDLGNRYLEELNYEEAAVSFQRVIELEDRNVDAWIGLAQANMGLAEMAGEDDAKDYYEQATSAYLKAIELDPGRTDSYLRLAEIYESTGQTEQAVALLEEALEKADRPEQIEEMLTELRQRHPATVHLTVMSQTSPAVPVPNAEVTVENRESSYSGETDENGIYTQELPAGEYTLIVRNGEEELYRQKITAQMDEVTDLGEISVETRAGEADLQAVGEELYSSILEMFYNWIATGNWNDDDFYYGLRNSWGEDWGEADEASYMWEYYFDGTLADAGYCIKDLNQDGIPELLVSPVTDAADGIIYDLFTYTQGEVVHLAASGERDLFYLCTDNTIAESGSSGAFESGWDYYFVRTGERTLYRIEVVMYDGYEDENNPWLYGDHPQLDEWGWVDYSSLTHISEDEAMAIIDSHEYAAFELTTFDRIAESIQNDEAQYQQQPVEDETSDSEANFEDFLPAIKSELLGIPDDIETIDHVGEPYYWEAGEIWLVYCWFEYNGEEVAAITVNWETGEHVRDLYSVYLE